MPLLRRRRPDCEKAMCFSSCESGSLVRNSLRSCPAQRSIACQVPVYSGGRSAGANPCSTMTANSFLLRPRAKENSLAPRAGGEPVFRDEEDDGFATLRSLMQLALPALARRYAALGIEVKKHFIPAAFSQPIGERLGFEIVVTGMADEYLRQDATPTTRRL